VFLNNILFLTTRQSNDTVDFLPYTMVDWSFPTIRKNVTFPSDI